MEQRFCGRALEISLAGVPEEKAGMALVFGEFRNKRSSSILEVGSLCGKDRLTDLGERIMFAELVRRSGDQDRFVIQPPRKWHYPGKLRSVDWHVIQLYAVIAEVVQATFISSAFHVVPIWKSDDKSERDAEIASVSIAPVIDTKAKEEDSDATSSSSSSSASSSSHDSDDDEHDESERTQVRQKPATSVPDSSTRYSAGVKAASGDVVTTNRAAPQVLVSGISPQLALASRFLPTGGLNATTNGGGVENSNNIHGGVEMAPPTTTTMSYLPSPFVVVGQGGTPPMAYHNVFVPTQMMNGQQLSFIHNMLPPPVNGPSAGFPMMGSRIPQVRYAFHMPSGNMSSTNQFGFRPSPTTSPNMTFAFPQAYPQQQQQMATQFVGVQPNNNNDPSKVNQSSLPGGLSGFRYYHPPA